MRRGRLGCGCVADRGPRFDDRTGQVPGEVRVPAVEVQLPQPRQRASQRVEGGRLHADREHVQDGLAQSQHFGILPRGGQAGPGTHQLADRNIQRVGDTHQRRQPGGVA